MNLNAYQLYKERLKRKVSEHNVIIWEVQVFEVVGKKGELVAGCKQPAAYDQLRSD